MCIRDRAGTRPILLVLEDLHWGDQLTIDRIDAVLAKDSRALLVLGLARPSLHTSFGEPWRQRAVQELRLRELPRRACIELARHVLGDIAPAALDAIARSI